MKRKRYLLLCFSWWAFDKKKERRKKETYELLKWIRGISTKKKRNEKGEKRFFFYIFFITFFYVLQAKVEKEKSYVSICGYNSLRFQFKQKKSVQKKKSLRYLYDYIFFWPVFVGLYIFSQVCDICIYFE